MLRYQRRILAIFSMFIVTSVLTGCSAGSVVRTICAAKTGEKDYSTRQYELELTASTDTGRSTIKRNIECTPTGYYCGGGEWRPQFAGATDAGFTFNVRQGDISIPLPSCGDSENIGREWTEIDQWPVANLHVGEDTFSINSNEIQQSSALRVIGIRVESYKQRRIAD